MRLRHKNSHPHGVKRIIQRFPLRHINMVGIAEDSVIGLDAIESHTKFFEESSGNFSFINQSEYLIHSVIVIGTTLRLRKAEEKKNE